MLSVTVRMVSVVTLNAVRPPHLLPSAEERRSLRPRRHDVGLRVGHWAVVTQPPVMNQIHEFILIIFEFHLITSDNEGRPRRR